MSCMKMHSFLLYLDPKMKLSKAMDFANKNRHRNNYSLVF